MVVPSPFFLSASALACRVLGAKTDVVKTGDLATAGKCNRVGMTFLSKETIGQAPASTVPKINEQSESKVAAASGKQTPLWWQLRRAYRQPSSPGRGACCNWRRQGALILAGSKPAKKEDPSTEVLLATFRTIMGQALSFCPPNATSSTADRRLAASSVGTSSSDGDEAASASAATSLASRHNNLLLVIVDSTDGDSPIKKRAEYEKSPTVADRIEQEVEEELRRRRKEETKKKGNGTKEAEAETETNTDATGQQWKWMFNIKRGGRYLVGANNNGVLVEDRDEIQNVDR